MEVGLVDVEAEADADADIAAAVLKVNKSSHKASRSQAKAWVSRI